jgi:hypothetical protein
VSGIQVALRLEEGFLALAISRGQTLLAVAGVPEPIARSPAAAREIAREFLQRLRENPRAMTDGNLGSLDALVDAALEQVARSYGEVASAQLRRWLQDHFIDEEARMCAWVWSVLLPLLAGKPGPTADLAGLAWRADTTERFKRAVDDSFRLMSGDEAAIRARMQPLSPLERQLLSLNTERDGPDERDVVDTLLEAEGIERARAAWARLQESLDVDEQRVLLAWARSEAGRRNIPLDLIARPHPA